MQKARFEHIGQCVCKKLLDLWNISDLIDWDLFLLKIKFDNDLKDVYSMANKIDSIKTYPKDIREKDDKNVKDLLTAMRQ